MSTIHGTGSGLGPATSKRQVYSPLEAYWIAFQEWRKRESQRTQLCRRTDSDLADNGTTRGGIDYVASDRTIDPTDFSSSQPDKRV